MGIEVHQAGEETVERIQQGIIIWKSKWGLDLEQQPKQTGLATWKRCRS